jgi:hypothetical protein
MSSESYHAIMHPLRHYIDPRWVHSYGYYPAANTEPFWVWRGWDNSTPEDDDCLLEVAGCLDSGLL